MLLERALSAGRGLVIDGLLKVTNQFRSSGCCTESALLQRLQSNFLASTSSSSSSSETFSSLAGALPCSSRQNTCLPHGNMPVQITQHAIPETSSCSSLAGSIRSYARAARMGIGRRGPQQQQSRTSMWRPPPELADLPLGRAAALCIPTEELRQPVFVNEYDPWKDRDPATVNPVEVDGSVGDDLEVPLMLRQQLEGSALPNELKRSRFISPAWDEVLLRVNRTVKVTKGGKVETLHALVAVGNHDGIIGIGEHSGKNIQKVMLDAQLKAYRNLVSIPLYRKHTVFHPIDVKNRKIRMQVWPRAAGFGVTASPLVTELCDLAGVKDVTIKLSGRRRNLRNVVYTFVDALTHQSLPHDGVEGTGVYMREVFHGKLPWGLKRGVDVP